REKVSFQFSWRWMASAVKLLSHRTRYSGAPLVTCRLHLWAAELVPGGRVPHSDSLFRSWPQSAGYSALSSSVQRKVNFHSTGSLRHEWRAFLNALPEERRE